MTMEFIWSAFGFMILKQSNFFAQESTDWQESKHLIH